MSELTRRGAIGLGLAGAAAPVLSAFAQTRPSRPAATGSLIGFASMIQDFRADPRFRETLLRHADIITPMNDLKWQQLRPRRDAFDFADADEAVNFARSNNRRVHGHALVWHDALPGWTNSIVSRSEAERELARHVETVLDRYKGRIESWDVVNEVIAHEPRPDAPLRHGFWLSRLGPGYIETAFRLAAKADPTARLVINEYDLEDSSERTANRRKILLGILRDLKSRGIPVHAVGMQAHLYGERDIDQKGLSTFVGELERMGIDLMITELDVIDWQLPARPEERDAAAARLVATLLDAVSVTKPPHAIISWGISDRSSWVSEVFRRKDGLANRPLPFDTEFREKPVWQVIAPRRIRSGSRNG
jgi:endo-1,4-beta-xylanase